jgi:hypothetical protein
MLYQLIEKILLQTHDTIVNFDGTLSSIILGMITYYLIQLLVHHVLEESQTAMQCVFNWKHSGLTNTCHTLAEMWRTFQLYIVSICVILFVSGFIYHSYLHPQQQQQRNWDLNEDPQNVHDHVINRYIIEAVHKLNHDITHPVESSYFDIHKYLTMSLHPKATQALEVLRRIKEINMYHEATHRTEMSILSLVWHRINHPKNNDHLDDLKIRLLEQLADCKVDGIVMCGVGRIARILQTLEGIDVDNVVTLQPTWAVKEEIGNFCQRYIQKLLKRLPSQYKEAIDTLQRSSTQKRLAKNFYACVKHNLHKKFKMKYIDPGILSEDQLQHISQVYLDELV